MVDFIGVLDIGKEEDLKMIKDKSIDGKKIVSRFKGILIKMISKVKDSLKIRHILLHWGYELEKSQKTL